MSARRIRPAASWPPARRALLRRADLESGGPVGEHHILRAERVVGRFPPHYRAFLSEFGWVAFGSVEIFGLGPTAPHHLDVVKMAVDEHGLQLPSHLIPVMNDGGGNLYCLTRADQPTDHPGAITLWAHDEEPDVAASIVASSFARWILTLATRA